MLEKAALQQRREEEALARRKAEKAQGSGGFSRGPERTESSEARRPVFGAGKWREREAARESGDAPPARAPPAERSDSNDRPSAGGPPRLNLSGGKPSWREREAAKQAVGGSGADAGSSAPPPRFAPRGGAPSMDRSGSGRGEDDRKPSPAPPAESQPASRTAGKWVPPHMRNK
jgi:translation initiation factor 3 subunit A